MGSSTETLQKNRWVAEHHIVGMLQCLSHAVPAPSQPQGLRVALIRISALTYSAYLMDLMLAGLLYKVENLGSPFCGQQKADYPARVLFPLFDHVAVGRKGSAAVQKCELNARHLYQHLSEKKLWTVFCVSVIYDSLYVQGVSCDYNFVVLLGLCGKLLLQL